MPNISHYHIVRGWFLINLFVCLYPPLYWAVGKSQAFVLGLPASFIYFMSISISVTLSILYAYWEESNSEELQ